MAKVVVVTSDNRTVRPYMPDGNRRPWNAQLAEWLTAHGIRPLAVMQPPSAGY